MKKIYILLIALTLNSCYRVSSKIEPKIKRSFEVEHIKNIPFSFPPLTAKERETNWGGEYMIARSFARDLDLYRAISTFKRSKILIPEDKQERVQEIDYQILLCYYLGGKPKEVIKTFEESSLPFVDRNFPAFNDLLIIMYETYRDDKNFKKAENIKGVINENREVSKRLDISDALLSADIERLKSFKEPYIDTFLQSYEKEKKSVGSAKFLNAILPGAGYLYLGQKKSAITSLLLNGLFIFASYEFFKNGYIAAGVITTSFEMGWYFGCIYGAGEEAKFYNERLYKENAETLMNKRKLFPFFMLNYAF